MIVTQRCIASIIEAAYIADIPVREVMPTVIESNLSSDLFDAKKGPTLSLAACVLVSFYFKNSSCLSKRFRLKVIKVLLEKNADLANIDDSQVFRMSSEDDDRWKLKFDDITIDFDEFAKPVLARLALLRSVSSQERIMDGEFTLVGTRVPARSVSFLVNIGMKEKEIKAIHPTITDNNLIRSAKLWSDLNPLKDIPKRFSDLDTDWKLLSTSKVRLKTHEISN